MAVEVFKKGKRYKFNKDFVYDIGHPMPRVECHVGDIATFDGPGLAGSARFYVKVRDVFDLIIVKRNVVFKLFDDSV